MIEFAVKLDRLQIQLGMNMPAKAEKQAEDGDKSFRQVCDVVLCIGIIDILQEYSMRKKIEHAYKSINYNTLYPLLNLGSTRSAPSSSSAPSSLKTYPFNK